MADELYEWLGGRLPGDWFTAPPDIQVDREEITIVGSGRPGRGRGFRGRAGGSGRAADPQVPGGDPGPPDGHRQGRGARVPAQGVLGRDVR